MDFLHVVLFVALLWAGLRKKKGIETQTLLGDDPQLAQLIQSQQTEIETLKEQLARSTPPTCPRCEGNGTYELTHAEIAQRDDPLKDFASERYQR